ncbi:unnamed protein product [Symbiodinium microadriaticum]|nr:unnamed protein product [Symbiodinium microadriaticum]CAE7905899.1 unnamed protein product [Symbiodinium sp. KB8]
MTSLVPQKPLTPPPCTRPPPRRHVVLTPVSEALPQEPGRKRSNSSPSGLVSGSPASSTRSTSPPAPDLEGRMVRFNETPETVLFLSDPEEGRAVSIIRPLAPIAEEAETAAAVVSIVSGRNSYAKDANANAKVWLLVRGRDSQKTCAVAFIFEVFQELQEELQAALAGEAVCILAYGATGSGKASDFEAVSAELAALLQVAWNQQLEGAAACQTARHPKTMTLTQWILARFKAVLTAYDQQSGAGSIVWHNPDKEEPATHKAEKEKKKQEAEAKRLQKKAEQLAKRKSRGAPADLAAAGDRPADGKEATLKEDERYRRERSRKKDKVEIIVLDPEATAAPLPKGKRAADRVLECGWTSEATCMTGSTRHGRQKRIFGRDWLLLFQISRDDLAGGTLGGGMLDNLIKHETAQTCRLWRCLQQEVQRGLVLPSLMAAAMEGMNVGDYNFQSRDSPLDLLHSQDSDDDARASDVKEGS